MKIRLLAMPFADSNRPSLGLTQLRARVLAEVPGADVSVLYLNQEADLFLGADLYRQISASYLTGLGDWLFRKLAFPEEPDNASGYFKRHFPYQDEGSTYLREACLEKREHLESWLMNLISVYQLDQMDVVGFSSMFSQTVACIALARMLKLRRPEQVTVIGGPNCDSPMSAVYAQRVPAFDFVFSGPALISFPRMLNYLQAGDHEALHGIPGVFSKKNMIHGGPPAPTGPDLPINIRVPLDYRSFVSDFDRRFPDRVGDKVLTFETSRGCWWGERSHCTFCGLNGEGMSYRAKSPDQAVQALEEVLAYAPAVRHFSSVDNIMPKYLIGDVLPRVKVPEGVEIFYEVKADLQGSEMKELARRGVTRLQPGIEALSTSTLKLMGKGTTAAGNIRFLKHCLAHGVFPEWNLLVGFPGEEEVTYQVYKALLPKLVHFPPPDGCYPVRFDRFSPYFNRADSYGLKLEPYDFYSDVFPFGKDDIASLAYYFQDVNYRARYARTMLRHIGELVKLVMAWKKNWETKPPQLILEPTGWIYDSRGSCLKHYRLSAAGQRLLAVFERASAPPQSLEGFTEADLRSGFEELNDGALLFEEGNRYQSLVVHRDPDEPKDNCQP